MFDITITPAALATPALPWDTVWDTAEGMGDWRAALPADPTNAGGLDARASIASGVILSLFTDRKAPEGWRPDVVDRRGWWGDSLALPGQEPAETGSWLWLLENETLSPTLPERARLYALEALAWMEETGLAGSVEAQAALLSGAQGITLHIDVRAQSGERLYEQRFDRLWRDVAR